MLLPYFFILTRTVGGTDSHYCPLFGRECVFISLPKKKAFVFVRTFYAFPCGGRGTALAVDEEKVRVKLTTNKIRIEPNTSSVRRDIIYPTPKPSAHVCHLLQGEGFRLGAHVLCLPQRGRGTALAVDEEKVSGKLTTNKIRIEPNTSSVRRDIIDLTPKPSSHVCHLPQGEGLYLGFSSSLPRGRLSFRCRTV